MIDILVGDKFLCRQRIGATKIFRENTSLMGRGREREEREGGREGCWALTSSTC
jgi:hypothetical protein